MTFVWSVEGMSADTTYTRALNFCNLSVTREVRSGMEDDFVLEVEVFPSRFDICMDIDDLRAMRDLLDTVITDAER